MTFVKVKIDDRVAFKGELDEWTKRVPDEFRNAVQPGATPKPHMKAILVAMADAVTTDQAATITVKTKLPFPEDGWSMTVTRRKQ